MEAARGLDRRLLILSNRRQFWFWAVVSSLGSPQSIMCLFTIFFWNKCRTGLRSHMQIHP